MGNTYCNCNQAGADKNLHDLDPDKLEEQKQDTQSQQPPIKKQSIVKEAPVVVVS
jgi:hypothetical protein